MDSTREKLLQAAEAEFADRGFYGASIAGIASREGLTKQALLHHFGNKEKLYGEVLQSISAEVESSLALAQQSPGSVADRLLAMLTKLMGSSERDELRNRLLMRELLDNSPRAPLVRRWYLKPFLEGVVSLLRLSPRWRDASDGRALAAVYQLLGMANYYSVSGPTLEGIFGSETASAMAEQFAGELRDRVQELVGSE